MRLSQRTQIGLAVMMMVAALAIFAWTWLPSGEHGCCAVAAQEQEEPDGNPDHVKPTQSCAANPKADQVQCKCAKHKKCNDEDGTVVESRKCRSFCYKDFCLCPDPPCI